MRIITIFCFLLLWSTSAMAGGGWVERKGHGYFKLGQNVIRAGWFFAPNGEVVEIPTTSLYTTSLYGEYGITDRLTAVAYVPFFVRATRNKVVFNQSGIVLPGDAIQSFGDTDLGLKWGVLTNKPVVLAVSLFAGLPFGKSEITSERLLQTGDGEWNQMLRVDASHSFTGLFYASAFLGFNNRTSGFSDEVHVGGEVGATLGHWVTILKLHNVTSLYNGTADETQANGVFSNNTEYFSFSPEVAWQWNDQMGLTAIAGLALSGKRILASPNFGLGAYFKL